MYTRKQLDTLAKYPAGPEYNRRMCRVSIRNAEREADKANKNRTVRFRAEGEDEFSEIGFKAMKAYAK
jgi:hypothetical protein